MTELTSKGEEKLKGAVRDQIARPLQFKWKGNLKENQDFLKDEIKLVETENGWRVFTREEILLFLEYGTSPHIIEAKDADALRWFNDDGEPVFRQKVKHPGTDPQAALRSAVDEVANQ